jgi:hypothetical protein
MNASAIGAVLLVPATIIGAFFFLKTYDQNHADQRATQIEMRRDRAEFDSQFAAALGGASSPQIDKRASDAEAAFETSQKQLQAEDAQRAAERQKDAAELKSLIKEATK